MTGPAWIPGTSSGATTTFPFTNKTATYTIDDQDCIINCTSNTFTVTLPTSVGLTGQFFVIKNSGNGIITIEADAAETIDGELFKVLAVQYESITVVSDGANWIIV